MSPYIVTTRRNTTPRTQTEHWVTSRVAVATLEKARSAANAEANQHGASAADYRTIYNLPESGGTVGPLPDGTVIEVEPTTWHDLTHQASNVGRYWLPADHGDIDAQQSILDAFNVRESTAA